MILVNLFYEMSFQFMISEWVNLVFLRMSSFANKSDLNVLLGSPGIYTWAGSTILLKESASGHRQIIIPNNKYMHEDYNYLGIVYNMYRY